MQLTSVSLRGNPAVQQGISLSPNTLVGGLAGMVVGAAAGAVAGLATGGGLRRALVLGGAGLVAGGIAGALIGPNLLTPAGPSDGRTVGSAIGKKMIKHDDGTSEWATITAPLLLDRRVGAAEGYATLAEAIAAAKPNTGKGEMAFLREGLGVTAFTTASPGLDSPISYSADAPNVVAYTTRASGSLFAGPAATPEEKALNHLVAPPVVIGPMPQ